IIDTPSRVFFPGSEPIGPPGINLFRIWIKIAERIDIPVFQKSGKLLSFFIRKAGVSTVCFGIFQIDFFVSHIEITAKNNRFFLIQAVQIRKESILPLHPIRKTRQFILRIRRIDGYQVISRILQGNHPSFLIVLFLVDSAAYRQRFLSGKNSRAGISFLYGIIPVLIISRQIHLNLPFLQLALLYTENIRVKLPEYIHISFIHTGSQSVDIPGNQFHFSLLLYTYFFIPINQLYLFYLSFSIILKDVRLSSSSPWKRHPSCR